MAASKHAAPKKTGARQTIMTRRGITDPALLKPEDLLIHNRRGSGPGTRSKNPYKYDSKARKTEQ